MFMGFRKYATNNNNGTQQPQPTIMKRAKSAGEASTASSTNYYSDDGGDGDDYEVSESELQNDLTLHTIHQRRPTTTTRGGGNGCPPRSPIVANINKKRNSSTSSFGQHSNYSSTELLLRSQFLEVVSQQQQQQSSSSSSDYAFVVGSSINEEENNNNNNNNNMEEEEEEDNNNKKNKRIATNELLKSQVLESYDQSFENSKLPDKSHTYPKFLSSGEVQIGKLLGQGGFAYVYEITGFTLSKDFHPYTYDDNTTSLLLKATTTTTAPAASSSSTTTADADADADDDKKDHKQPPLPPPPLSLSLSPQQLQPQQREQQKLQPLCEDEGEENSVITKGEDLEKTKKNDETTQKRTTNSIPANQQHLETDDDDDDDDDSSVIISRYDKFESINLHKDDNVVDDDDDDDDLSSSFCALKDFSKCTELQQKLDYQQQMAAREFLTKHCFRPCSNNNQNNNHNQQQSDNATTTPTITDSSYTTSNDGGVTTAADNDGDNNEPTKKKMDARYALKRLKPSVIADSDHLMQGIADMATESRFLASLEYHPNIIKLRGMARERFTSEYFIIMDKLGDTLEQRINNVWRPKEKKSKFTKVINKFKKLSTFGSSPNIRDLGSGRKKKKRYNSGGDLRGGGCSGSGRANNGLAVSLPNKKWNTYNSNDNNGSSSLSSSSKRWYNQSTLTSRLQACYGIASALGHLHKHRILYRDLKPANVGFDVRDDIKIFDFGLAKELLLSNATATNDDDDNNNKNAVYNLTMLCGTPRYMAPEVARGEPYNESCDVYSFAILCWQILRLRVPYGKKCNFDLLQKVWFDEQNIIRPEIPKTSSWPIHIQQMLHNAFKYDLTQRPRMKEMGYILKKEYGVAVSRSNGGRTRSSGGGGGGGEDVAAAVGGGTSKATPTASTSDNLHDDNNILDDSLRSSSMSAAKKRRSTHIFGSGRAMGMKADGFGKEMHNLFEGVSSSGRLSILDSSIAKNIASESMEMLHQQEKEEPDEEDDDDSNIKSSNNLLKSTGTTPTASAAESQPSIEKSSDQEDE